MNDHSNRNIAFLDAADGDIRQAEPTDIPEFMPDEDRKIAFVTIAALVDSGLSLASASDVLIQNYRKCGAVKSALSLEKFFAAAAMQDRDTGYAGYAPTLLDIAMSVFGKPFVSLEEALILSTLPYSRDAAATLRAAVELIERKGNPKPRTDTPRKRV